MHLLTDPELGHHWQVVGDLPEKPLGRRISAFRGRSREVASRPRRVPRTGFNLRYWTAIMDNTSMESEGLHAPTGERSAERQSFDDALVHITRSMEAARLSAAQALNSEAVLLNWRIGTEMRTRQRGERWDSREIARLAADLRVRFPEAKGYSRECLEYMQRMAEAYADEAVVRDVFAKLPWKQNKVLIDRLTAYEDRLWYAQQAIAHGWGVAVLTAQIETGLRLRMKGADSRPATVPGASDTDRHREILAADSALALLSLPPSASTRRVEHALVANFRRLLLGMGHGFAYFGNQYRLDVGKQNFLLDLLFYHIPSHRFVVFDLRLGAFSPELAGQMCFYVTTIDDLVSDRRKSGTPLDEQTIGIVICRDAGQLAVKYTLRADRAPVGLGAHDCHSTTVPVDLLGILPSALEFQAIFRSAERAAEEQERSFGRRTSR
ncbi:MAG: hypothetical protein JWM95_373 [Gemmatimonadetes bacterium]|nr:hypothetical protein [Gemmatimonadota bacterium]